MTATITNNEVAIFSRVIRPERNDLSLEAARSLLSLDFDPQDHDRMNELSAKARQGTLSSEEEQELKSYVHVGHILALLQSKARQSLNKVNGNP
ncbi:MAG: hypothetical protein L0Z62_21805 [Gemmataceae bacterium]|nr:hypothetical protein [Gemmataceae bacterium]